MNLASTTKTAFQSIITNKGRSLLTMLGVIIGVAAVILLVAIGNGLQSYITKQFEDFGSNNIFIAPGEVLSEGGGFNQEEQESALLNNKLKYEDVETIGKIREYISGVSALSVATTDVSYRTAEERASITGVNSSYSDITNTKTPQGAFFTESDEQKGSSVAVLGFKIKEDLFGNVDAIGKNIKINNRTFKVIGVAEEKGGGFGGPSFDTYIYIPITTFSKLFDQSQVSQIVAKAKSAEAISPGIAAIEEELLKRLEEDEFSVFDLQEILGVINQILGALTAGLGGIAAISLLVGGIGIMNIMLVSVTERTREIGLRKALGATPNDILVQFLIEAIFLSVTGGLLGVGIATGASTLINQFFPSEVTLSAVLLAFGVSTAVGVIFGVYPARKASRLSPIEALRYE